MVGTFIRIGWQGNDRARQGGSGQVCGVQTSYSVLPFCSKVDRERGSPRRRSRTRRPDAPGTPGRASHQVDDFLKEIS
ncbi:hypothetical protein CS0771_59220 [Catellatospora sp. IY07-71]|uniref:hypothetical protein n=1 Tax=Catellatospora sp. IY07-71 TaxID=2728827 RepID=UPI001BB390C7|nr:hypothetical protein [Catellatospora sp. IY07-71]BCJ76378.1 hypothetical protein CS0771_59220 [Catellatospora sp. IY07-71]